MCGRQVVLKIESVHIVNGRILKGYQYGPIIIGTCKVCGRGTAREVTTPKACLDCGTVFELVFEESAGDQN